MIKAKIYIFAALIFRIVYYNLLKIKKI